MKKEYLEQMVKRMQGVINGNFKINRLLNKYGFATIAAIGMGWFIHFIYKYVTTEIMKKLGEMNVVLIALIDRVRMLDNDLIRLKSKLETVLEIKENTKKTPTKK